MDSPSSMVRSLAIRTMACIRVEDIAEYLCQPLRKLLKDSEAYVRKTAAVCVAKLYDLNPEMTEDQGLIDELNDMLSDNNPVVVSNVVCALSEISSRNSTAMELNKETIAKLLVALNECTEWGQVSILDSLAHYRPDTTREAESIIERVAPRLSHVNAAVVLSAVKVLVLYLDYCEDTEFISTYLAKLTNALVSLLSFEPELQWVALRNIELIIQRYPSVLSSEVKVFFCKFNDPGYVKIEKLEILVLLASDKNVDQVLMEFKEYASEVAVDVVRKAIRCFGRVAIKLERSSERCVLALLELIEKQPDVNFIIQEAIIVIKDIFRRYPGEYESIISQLAANLSELDEPEAKAAMVWIIGEYASRIENAASLLSEFLDNFEDEEEEVKMQIVTAVVKLYLQKDEEGKDMLKDVLKMATEDTEHHDLRDRAFLYWRLLSAYSDEAQVIVMSEKPLVADDTNAMAESTIDVLLQEMSTVASVLHKPPSSFIAQSKAPVDAYDSDEEEDLDYKTQRIRVDDQGQVIIEDLEEESSGASESVDDDGDDLINFGGSSTTKSSSSSVSASSVFEDKPVGLPEIAAAVTPLVHPSKLNQLGITGGVGCNGENIFLKLNLHNKTGDSISKLPLQMNVNSFGLKLSGQPSFNPVSAGATQAVTVNLMFGDTPKQGDVASDTLQFAVKGPQDKVAYFAVAVPFQVMFTPDGKIAKKAFLEGWKAIDDSEEIAQMIDSPSTEDVDEVQQLLEVANVFVIHTRRNVDNEGTNVMYLSTKSVDGPTFLSELTFKQGSGKCRLCTKTRTPAFAPLFAKSIVTLLGGK
eukprot:TRINITY_DN427_c0_g1_i19.p1 TRINITY_DN427_c0_g1~~TRINITY_DN427_c0_g1_i19.p1  ORF type:complete len:812 (+),score=327.51 TRINITY_DN427_c0_g1_i19:2357-4792(+)